MKLLWSWIDKKNMPVYAKYRLALLTAGVLSALLGFVLWLVIRSWTLSTADWMVCFIGYPVIISWLVVFFYSCHHAFHSHPLR